MDKQNLKIKIGDLEFKNPLFCGSAEHFIEEAGIKKAVEEGAAVVVAKSTNESENAKTQLDKTDYALIDSSLNNISWGLGSDMSTGLIGRSGLVNLDSKEWLKKISELDNWAEKKHSYVAASIIPRNMSSLEELAKEADQLGIRILEINIGAPHASEMKSEIETVTEEKKVSEIVMTVRRVFNGSLWLKLGSTSENVSKLCMAAKSSGADAVVMIGRMMAMFPDLDSMMPTLRTNVAYGGRWALPITCRWLSESRKMVGDDFPLIGTNGARDGCDIARMMLSGASGVQITSSIFTKGFEVISKSLLELSEYLESKGTTAEELIGLTADRVEAYDTQNTRPEIWKEFVPKDALD